ncbi:hypothetical protein N825_36070 [Skermanella stibiiresistens SB22]|uniref:Fervidolysin-like N-terminal prodomain domain-containing protein n=1 Tax=Skermanella stibiiresistens SB22 TaxID=1385369 RepID=W9GP98_9PROT|nr:hypothetical protein [Skermanella stibiiresistens]EWY35690.1 hypothetical protein N825_36070 [Skermanella stibiiresistens SB22]
MAGWEKACMAFALAIIVGGTTGPLLAEQPAASQPQPKPVMTEDLLVKFSSDLSEEEIQAINDRLGVEVVDRTRDGRFYQIRVPEPRTLADIQKAYEETSGIEYVERSVRYQIQPEKDDQGSRQ